MAELESVSKIVKIQNSDNRMFRFLSDMRNFTSLVPPNAVENLNVCEDYCTFTVKGQNVEIHILDKEEFKTIKFGTQEGTPMGFKMWIQLKSLSAYETAARITVRADVPLIMKPMIKGKLAEGVDKLADGLRMLPY